MNEGEVVHALNKVGAIIFDSHVVYTSGKHGSTYINKDAVYPHTAETSRLCHALAERFAGDNIQVVIAPAIGGVILSQWLAYHLTEMNGREVLGVYAEKEGTELVSSSYGPLPPKYENAFVIKRGYDKLIAGKNVLVVEDILNTGGSARKVIDAASSVGGNIVGLGVLCNRGGITARDLSVLKLVSLIDARSPDVWDEGSCPLCERDVPINTDVGKGREFLARQRKRCKSADPY
ncbi:phosphoribosyltransferase [Candidatus Parcubacteria bacterium]|nr:MAG: phosphoribosyltransferase [Candidatus Parcubacteria bacterium]